MKSFRAWAMFRLDNNLRFLLYNKPVDMRKSFNGLSGIVTNILMSNPSDGTVYVFLNKARNRVKLLHREKYGMVVYILRIDISLVRQQGLSPSEKASQITYDYLVDLISSSLESPYARRLKLLSKNMYL